MRCRECKFWQCDNPEQYIYGDCHRRAPLTEKHVTAKSARWGGEGLAELTITDTRRPAWPNTHEDDWCGEFEKKE